MCLDSCSICLKLLKNSPLSCSVVKLSECNLKTTFIISSQGIAELEPRERLAVNEQYGDDIYFHIVIAFSYLEVCL